ncbi:PspC domain-containing protein [Kitasatospora cinereorecta]|uniref:PspC domain-containing protein n=1 Tax=Kitasatospora cinereorecta TaxID=285560 RepID=A0ABW0V478_9ACTN
MTDAPSPNPPADDAPGDATGAADAAARPALTRSSRHRVVAGVCGGVGRHLDIDPVVFRVVVAVLCLTGGLGLFLYGLAWLIVPREVADGGSDEGGRTELQRVLTGRVDGQSIGAVLLTVIGTGVFFSSMGDGDQLLPLLLLGGLIFLAVRYDPERRRRAHGHHRHHRPAAPWKVRDRLEPEGERLDWTAWGQRMGEEMRAEWQARMTEVHERIRSVHEEHAEARAAGTVPADTPPPGPSGYLWDPRHPERNPYAGATPPPGAAAQAWWQRTDLPSGDPLRKQQPQPVGTAGAAETAGVARPMKVRRHHSFLGPLAVLTSLGAAAATVVIGGHGHGDLRLSLVLAAALLPLGLALLIGSRYGRVRGLVVPALLVTLALAGTANSATTLDDAFGDRTWTVSAPADLQSTYSLAAGDAKLDLSGLNPAGAELGTEVRLGAGDLRVTVPSDVEVRLTVRSGLGEVRLPDGERISGAGTDRMLEVHPTGGRAATGTLDLTLMVGLGDTEVVQA